MSLRALKLATAAASLVPIVTGLMGLAGLHDPRYLRYGTVVANTVLDSNLRYFSGFWLGGGLAMLWVVPRLEKQGAVFNVLWGMIFLGGIGRVISIADTGLPAAPLTIPILGLIAVELLGAPAFVLWRRRVCG